MLSRLLLLFLPLLASPSSAYRLLGGGVGRTLSPSTKPAAALSRTSMQLSAAAPLSAEGHEDRATRRRRLALTAGMLATTSVLLPGIAAATTGEPNIGQRVATSLRSSGLPDSVIVAAIAGMPVVELRGAIPVGVLMGVPLVKTFFLCVLGNMVPIVPLLLALRAPIVQRLLKKPLEKARSKSSQVLDGDKRWTALAAFVGVPFPGTGAWTGAMIAFVLGMPLAEALSAIFAGVVSAGLIVAALTSAGKAGAAIVVAALVVTLVASALTKKKE